MKKERGSILIVLLIVLAICGGVFIASMNKTTPGSPLEENNNVSQNSSSKPLPTTEARLPEPPTSHQLTGASHAFQTFNNCGPASLSMALSLYDIVVSQQELGNELRPYQNAAGDNDDKSVTLEELAEKARDYNLVPYHRSNGDMDKIKSFIAQGFPVITRTLLTEGNDIGHYRVVTGYNNNERYIVQNDSLQGRDLQYSYDNFLALWKPYGYEYLVLVPEDKIEIAETILGDERDARVAWQNSVERLKGEIQSNPNDAQLKFSLAVAYYHTGEYEKTIQEFEAVESRLPFRTLWYQIEPLLAYQKLERYDELLPRIQAILDRHNRAFSELYQIRGEVYLDQERTEDARREFETALVYNRNFEPARESLSNI